LFDDSVVEAVVDGDGARVGTADADPLDEAMTLEALLCAESLVDPVSLTTVMLDRAAFVVSVGKSAAGSDRSIAGVVEAASDVGIDVAGVGDTVVVDFRTADNRCCKFCNGPLPVDSLAVSLAKAVEGLVCELLSVVLERAPMMLLMRGAVCRLSLELGMESLALELPLEALSEELVLLGADRFIPWALRAALNGSAAPAKRTGSSRISTPIVVTDRERFEVVSTAC
jgi:hypothetical protein